MSGRTHTARVQGSITSLKICGLVAFACAGLSIGWRNTANLWDSRATRWTQVSPPRLMSSMVYIYYAYTGWNSAAYLAGEIRDAQAPAAVGDPARNGRRDVAVPGAQRRLRAGVISAAKFERSWMIRQTTSAAKRSRRSPRSLPLGCSGQDGRRPSRSIFGTMLLSTLSAYVLIGPRVVYAMAKAGQFPAIAAQSQHACGYARGRHRLQTSVALLLLWTGSFENLIIYAGVGLSIFCDRWP